MHLLGIGEKIMFAIKHVISVIFSLKTTSPIFFSAFYSLGIHLQTGLEFF